MDTTSAPAASAGTRKRRRPTDRCSTVRNKRRSATSPMPAARSAVNGSAARTNGTGRYPGRKTVAMSITNPTANGLRPLTKKHAQPAGDLPQPLDEQCGQGDRDGQKRQRRIKSQPQVNGMALERIGIIE